MSIQLPPEGEFASALAEEEREQERRRRLIVLLALLLTLIVCLGAVFVRYLLKPTPLPEILPLPVSVDYAPHYLFSIYGVDKPTGVAISPQGDRVYVTETDSERLVKFFDRDGDLLGALAPPRTKPGERAPAYVATDNDGRVFVTDRLQGAVFVFDRDGLYLDTILGPNLTLSAYVFDQLGGSTPGLRFAYNVFEHHAVYREPGEVEEILPTPQAIGWAPLGIEFDERDGMLLTDVTGSGHIVRVVPDGLPQTGAGQDFDASQGVFGASGQEPGQFLFPNAVVRNSSGRIFVSDSNNGRVSAWEQAADGAGEFLFNFGVGTDAGALSLPRGLAIDGRGYLHVVDTVGQCVKVYDVSGAEPRFLFAFGGWGAGDGQFDFPNDITIDSSGRLYITDRENNRVQVWSY